MANVVEYKNIITFHPGYYVKEIMEELDLDIKGFAKRLNLTPIEVTNLIQGKISVSNILATCLETEFQVSAETWLNLQQKYDEMIAEIDSRRKGNLWTKKKGYIFSKPTMER